MQLVQQAEHIWNATGISGVDMSPLWSNTQGDGSYFARFAAGAKFPAHDHQGWEVILILEGAIEFNGVLMQAGDVLQVESGEQHSAIACENTLLFVTHRGGIAFLDT